MPAPMPWWRRPVGLRGLLWVGLGVALIWGGVLALGVWSFYRHWQVQVSLRDQPVELRLPAGLRAVATVDEPMVVPLQVRPSIQVVLDQPMQATLDQPILARVKLQAELPISTSVRVQQDIPVQTTLHMKVPLRSWLPPVEVALPVQFKVPVDWTLPVQAVVPLRLDVLVSGQIRHSMSVPVQATWTLRPEIDTRLSARMVGQTVFAMKNEVLRFPVDIERADLRLPFNLRLVLPQDASANRSP
jgi:hypothetical protein